MDTPDIIYLVDMGDTIAWCDEPHPDMSEPCPEDDVAYVKASRLRELVEEWRSIVAVHRCSAISLEPNSPVYKMLKNCADQLEALIKEVENDSR